ncbi:hypothetical protein IAQ61_006667 [Plenodomus lingam]|uniref:uncharacterized protein n=1 Tax=Leptosphaeria maculans TaxID=5022 RepID=UPI00331A0FF6|nr:hypothetical protein IAQ61_006667 [Plenodomus lingam]
MYIQGLWSISWHHRGAQHHTDFHSEPRFPLLPQRFTLSIHSSIYRTLDYLFDFFKIGRKHKAHRQQAQQDKAWRNAEKGRGKPGKGRGKRSKMGSEESRVVDENVEPQTLQARTLEALAQYIREGKARKIVVMTGAGISTSAGIPDFRSPDTGLYANLSRLNLPYAEAVFDISYFRTNPEPFYTLAQELYPGKFRPTITHSFIALLEKKGLLLKLFTQNIDCLEREAGVSDERIIEAHGSFAKQSCIDCKYPYPADLMHEAISSKTVPRCQNPTCNGLVKPEIVFFGEQLPAAFFDNRSLPAEADLCIIMGTSLSVHPFASLPQMCRPETPRLLINSEQVGGLGDRADDVLLLEDCDEGVKRLASALGWLEELEALWATTARDEAPPTQEKKTRDEILQAEVEKLTREVEENLRLGKQQQAWLDNHVDEKIARNNDQDAENATPDLTAPSPPDQVQSKLLAPVATSPPTLAKTDPGGRLDHVFPFLKKERGML